jgi:hypothetical protein
MPFLLAGQAQPRTDIVSVRLSIFMSAFLGSYFLAERRSSKALLQLIVPVFVQQDLHLEHKPLVDWLKVAVVQENGAYILGVNHDPVLLAMDNALMWHWMMLHNSNLPGHWAPLPST